MQQYFLHVKVNQNGITAEPISLFADEQDLHKINQFFYNTLNIQFFDIVSYNDELDLIVDDEGRFVVDNPIFIMSPAMYKEPLIIYGDFLVGRKIQTEEGFSVVGFESKDKLKEALAKAEFSVSIIGFN